MSKQINLLVVYGGKSGEHEVSLVSAASVLRELDAKKYHIIPVGMDKQGRFFLNDYQELLNFKDRLPVSTSRSRPLPSLLVDGRLAVDADVVFPVVHGPLYEDGCLQGLLKLAGVAFVGCDVLSSAIGMDKDVARRLACTGDIQSARYRLLSWHSTAAEKQQFCQQVVAEFGWPLFVKPCSLGSSVGIHKARNMEELNAAIADALRYDEAILVEEFIVGREIELAVLENTTPAAAPRVSLAGEIRVHHNDGFYSYTAKYLESEQTELHAPAQLNPELVTRLQTLAAEIFNKLKCKGMARVDFFVNDESGAIYFNEINSLPGFTPISMYPKLWQVSGLAYPLLLDELINLALSHQRCRQQLVTDYQ
ncbi:D-alanine--D-alanine ligase family protein [Legionella jordanis]|uniref:D-alanine--D-alanine ligase n=1 Tax=Legionella jordanis TaxID=456 RepID=A0A0W0VDH8_9GAMM|nr:D-alanine--D-alanine ligase family protein [Legionella jordanis]KTD18209.1 D-alanine--D-alanine ligase [Legionella jordanis]RMX01169.1 D-alanine--D-alanine ligase A [Legionella jordanis]RMX21399.1 D-alanine--D-alanine ligase A [Legionella jordanis]VEH13698.1 D-alanine--D-alanine ligase [Legionella jordanis]HAT8714591.1 D-alanine--D-alanine ligase [Legionella jordanis]